MTPSPTLAPVPELAELDGPFAVTTLADIETDIAFGPSASLIYVEGEVALYLDEEDTDLALHDVTDRDLKILAGLVTLASERVNREQTIRNVAASRAQLSLFA